MITEPSQRRNRLGEVVAEMRQWILERLAAPTAPMPLERPNLAQLARAEAKLPACVAACPGRGSIWTCWDRWIGTTFQNTTGIDPGRGHRRTRAPFVAAYLVKLEQDKRYMARLALFPGGFTTESVAALMDITPAAALDALERLLEKNIIRLSQHKTGPQPRSSCSRCCTPMPRSGS